MAIEDLLRQVRERRPSTKPSTVQSARLVLTLRNHGKPVEEREPPPGNLKLAWVRNLVHESWGGRRVSGWPKHPKHPAAPLLSPEHRTSLTRREHCE